MMHETLREPHGAHDVEKRTYDGEQLDNVETHSPASEGEKARRNNLDYTKTGSRVVHEKVSFTEPCGRETMLMPCPDERQTFHDTDVHVFLMGWLANPTVPLRFSTPTYLPRHWRCRPLGLVCYRIPDPQRCPLSVCGCAFRSLWATEGGHRRSSLPHRRAHHHGYGKLDEHRNWYVLRIDSRCHMLTISSWQRILWSRCRAQRTYRARRNWRSRARQGPRQVRRIGGPHDLAVLSIGHLRPVDCTSKQLAIQRHSYRCMELHRPATRHFLLQGSVSLD